MTLCINMILLENNSIFKKTCSDVNVSIQLFRHRNSSTNKKKSIIPYLENDHF